MRNSVDLPQPLDPMIVVITPGGISTCRSSMTLRAPYPTVTPRATRRAVPPVPDAACVMC